MANLKWHNFFEIGIDFIDEEHKSLLKTMNDVKDAIESKKFEIASSLLALLLKEAETHFLNEEDFLEKVKYPGLEEHRKYHKELLRKTLETKRVCESVEVQHDTQKCFDNMAEFLIDDILQGDIGFKSYLEYEGYIKPAGL